MRSRNEIQNTRSNWIGKWIDIVVDNCYGDLERYLRESLCQE